MAMEKAVVPKKEEIIKALHNMDDEGDFAFSVRFAYQTVSDGINFLKQNLVDCRRQRGVVEGWEAHKRHKDNIADIENELKFFEHLKKEIEQGTIDYDILYLINHLAVPEPWEDLANKRIMKKYCSFKKYGD